EQGLANSKFCLTLSNRWDTIEREFLRGEAISPRYRMLWLEVDEARHSLPAEKGSPGVHRTHLPGPLEKNQDYQRLRRSPPPLFPPPLRLGRCSCGRASFTTRVRPESCEPCKALMACCASAGELISTNPNPRDCPVYLSAMTRADSTVPWAENNSWSCSSVTE